MSFKARIKPKQFTSPLSMSIPSKQFGSRAAANPREMAQELFMVAQIMKSQFPNLDQSFFKSPRLLAAEQDVVRDPYQNSVWVYAACQAITTNILQVPKALDRATTKEQELVINHPVMELMENPNPLMDWNSFWETVMLSLLLPTPSTKGGQCFIVADPQIVNNPPNLKKGDIPEELWPYDDSAAEPLMEKVLGGGTHLWGWRFKFGGQNMEFPSEQLIRIRLTDPKNMLKGQSPLFAAMRSMRQDLKAQKVNENFFDNNASLGGVLSTEGEMTQDQADAAKEKFEEIYGGTDNAGKVAALAFGLKYQQFQRTHKDMEFLEQRKFTRDEILAVYRVPKAEVTIYEDINYATSKQADRNFWQKTLIPLDRRILTSINNQWIRYVDRGNWRLVSDYSNVEGLREDFGEKIKQAAELVKMQVPLEEVNRRLEMNLSIEKYEWLKTALINFNLVPAEDVMEGENKPTDNPPPADDGDDDKQLTAEEKAYQDRYWDKVVGPGIRRFDKKTVKFFKAQANRQLALVRAWAKTAKKGSYPTLTDLTLSLRRENEVFIKLVRNEYLDAIERERQNMETELGESIGSKDIDWNVNIDEVQDSLKERLAALRGINRLTFKRVLKKAQKILKESKENRLTVVETARALREGIGSIYGNMVKFRTKTIARTEMGVIHSKARYSMMRAAKVKEIQWLTAKDEKVRSKKNKAKFPHDILHKNKVKFGKSFSNGDPKKIKFPKDTGASAGNIINCRCTFRIAKRKS